MNNSLSKVYCIEVNKPKNSSIYDHKIGQYVYKNFEKCGTPKKLQFY